ncbi:MAG: hypothetical protein KGM44_10740 [bacterium]|nr:hypothetical protein [bacterium]
MQSLVAPETLEVPSRESLRVSVFIQNDGEDDTICMPALVDLEHLIDVTFEPPLSFVGAHQRASFDVRIRRAGQRWTALPRDRIDASWLLYVGDELRERRPCTVLLEQQRRIVARFAGDRFLHVENRGQRIESLSLRIAPGFAGELLAPKCAITLAPHESRDVPLQLAGYELGRDRLGIMVVGGPERILLQADVDSEAMASGDPSPGRNRSGLPRDRIATWGTLAAEAVAIVLGLGLALTLAGRLPIAVPFLSSASSSPEDLSGDASALQNAPTPPYLQLGLPLPPVIGIVPEPERRHRRSAVPVIVALHAPRIIAGGRHFRVHDAVRRARWVEITEYVDSRAIARRWAHATVGWVALPAPDAEHRETAWVRLAAVGNGGHAARSASIAIVPHQRALAAIEPNGRWRGIAAQRHWKARESRDLLEVGP